MEKKTREEESAMTLPTSPGKGKTTNKKNLKKKAKKISTKKKSSKTKR